MKCPLMGHFIGSALFAKMKTSETEQHFNLVLFVLMLYTSQSAIFQSYWDVFSVFLGSINTNKRIKCLAQGNNTVHPLSHEPATPQSQLYH